MIDQSQETSVANDHDGVVHDEECLLSVENLQVEFHTSRGRFRAVDGVSWSVKKGETLALVGESGCGKSVSALSVMQLLPKTVASIVGGKIMFAGDNLLSDSESTLRKKRGRDISMILSLIHI